MIISTVAQILNDRPLAKVGPDDSVRNACNVMCSLDVGAVVVMQGNRLLGVMSERDVIRKCTCAHRHTGQTKVSEIMTADPVTIDTDGSLAEVLEIMGRGGFHHVPVLRKGEAIGMISADDIPEEYRMLLQRFKEFREG
jgi:CBS domain-containing protein